MKIKVCGITQEKNMREVAALQPDYMGFIFYPPSPRDVSKTIDSLNPGKLPKTIQKVAVTVNMALKETIELVKKYEFDLVQLHGEESPGYCTEMRKYARVIKTFRVNDKLPDNLDLYENHCDFFLFDTRADLPGGTGLSFNHEILNKYYFDLLFFLSGGISPQHLDVLINMNYHMLHSIDINSKFEIQPGIKNIEELQKFINRIRNQK